MTPVAPFAHLGQKQAKLLPVLLFSITLIGMAAGTIASAVGRRETLEFDELRFFVEANATDGDAEINFEWDSDVALRDLSILSPNGRPILSLKSRDNERLGLRKGIIETPEPAPEAVLAAYPEGIYRFEGRGVGGEGVSGELTLSHRLPPAPVITSPPADAEGVPLAGLGAIWNAVEGATAYALELETETEDGELKLQVDLPAGVTSFIFPPGWVLPEAEYQVGVAVRDESGNVNVTEIQFTTGT